MLVTANRYCTDTNQHSYSPDLSTKTTDSGVTGGGGGGSPQRLLTGKFLWCIGKKRQGKKREKGWKLRRKEGKSEKGRWKKKPENGSRKSYKKSWGPFFFFFAFHFWKRRKFVLGLPKWEFSAGGKIRKNDFAPSEKYACYAPDHRYKEFTDQTMEPDMACLDKQPIPTFPEGALWCFLFVCFLIIDIICDKILKK